MISRHMTIAKYVLVCIVWNSSHRKGTYLCHFLIAEGSEADIRNQLEKTPQSTVLERFVVETFRRCCYFSPLFCHFNADNILQKREGLYIVKIGITTTIFIPLFISGSSSHHHYHYNYHLAHSGFLPMPLVSR